MDGGYRFVIHPGEVVGVLFLDEELAAVVHWIIIGTGRPPLGMVTPL